MCRAIPGFWEQQRVRVREMCLCWTSDLFKGWSASRSLRGIEISKGFLVSQRTPAAGPLVLGWSAYPCLECRVMTGAGRRSNEGRKRRFVSTMERWTQRACEEGSKGGNTNRDKNFCGAAPLADSTRGSTHFRPSSRKVRRVGVRPNRERLLQTER